MTAFNARRHEALAYDILAPEVPRARQRRVRTRASEPVVEAEFITIREPAAADPRRNDNRQAAPRRPSALEIARTLAERLEKRLARLSTDGFSALVAAACVGVFVLAGGLSGFFPAETPAAPPRPLVITHANLTPQQANGMPLLIVNGIVENRGHTTMEVPPIRAELMAGEARVASLVIDPPVASVKPGQSHGFVARIAHPGGKTPELKLSFGAKDVPGL
ncbi:hypothetical protein NOF55_18950 [Rhizobiaceae bacterium BDR2-2]|uniref:DUF3426 domain-containing protein n=1 Tax=Ectorhizobium quercum TaxID=2965071 RepID=A0AAE3SWI5_9HYPH|nr:hypothetical protein [Ectorhizobium quercum]MCX8999187.1 hypothetical protein [Ectorhizobium quercum]